MEGLEAYDYHLPPEQIAQEGVEPRDMARLMVVYREGPFRVAHKRVRDLPEFLRPGDVLVFNESKVIPARLLARKPTGGKVEILLVRERSPGFGKPSWAPRGRRPRNPAPPPLPQGPGPGPGPSGGGGGGGGGRGAPPPLPRRPRGPPGGGGGGSPSPYIKAKIPMERYQTVYARRPGSVAAPTAGLHFTPELLERLREMGVELRFLTLHVGPGTFRPVKGDPEKHEMHAEPYAIPEEVAEAVNRAKAEGRRVVAVGTTVVRALESAYREGVGVVAGEGETRLFIRPLHLQGG